MLRKENRFVVKQKNRGRSNQSISSEVSLSIRQIQNIFKTAKEEQRFMRKKGSGRPEALSKYDKIRISKKRKIHTIVVLEFSVLLDQKQLAILYIVTLRERA